MKSIIKLASEKGMTKQEYVKWYFAQNHCELLEEYEHTMKRMQYKCRCGRISTVSWNKFTQRNRRCGFCGSNGRKMPHTIEEVKKIFIDGGCELYETQYFNTETPMRYKCQCGNDALIPLSSFKIGQRCKKCGIAKNSGENHHNWVTDREQLKLNKIFRKKCYKALQRTVDVTGQIKIGHTSDWIGYGPKELQNHIKNHPNWNKVKNKKWHLDHKFPIQAFINNSIIDPKIINALDNLQPISQKENNSKSYKYDKNKFSLDKIDL